MSTMQSVQEVDVGESAPRTIVSRLAETTNFEEVMHTIFFANIVYTKMQRVISD